MAAIATAQMVHVIDGDVHTCEAVCATLLIEGYRVGFTTTVAEGAKRAKKERADLIILSERIGSTSTLDMIQRLHIDLRGVPVIIMQDPPDLHAAVLATRAGAADVLAKPIQAEHLLASIRTAVAESTPMQDLTRREVEVFTELLDGRTNKEVARSLGISSRTIEVHRARILRKFGARNVTELLRMILR